jgi:hypothetical protein
LDGPLDIQVVLNIQEALAFNFLEVSFLVVNILEPQVEVDSSPEHLVEAVNFLEPQVEVVNFPEGPVPADNSPENLVLVVSSRELLELERGLQRDLLLDLKQALPAMQLLLTLESNLKSSQLPQLQVSDDDRDKKGPFSFLQLICSPF